MVQKFFMFIFLFIVATNPIWAQNLKFSSQLPLVFIDTGGREIRDEPKINARMGMVWNGRGETNSTSDPKNGFDEKIAIEIRGSSSQMFPKKSYGFETRDSLNRDTSVSLLGMPEEEDWILYAPYSDKTLIRNSLTFCLAGQFGVYTPRTRQVELFLNNEYQGVYVLMEKIKRDKNRVDIPKLTEKDISGEDLTGGYIVKIDKTTGSGGSGWHSVYSNAYGVKTYYQYEYPKADEILEVQKAYIQNYISDFETAVKNKDHSPETGYRSYIEITSFFDYIIINELAKNVDGYRLSTFLHKDKNGKLVAGPVWDFNLAYGNANYARAWEYYGLQVYADLGSDGWQNPFWWETMLRNQQFANDLKCRWQQLRENELSNERVTFITDSLIAEMDGATNRNFKRWPVLGEWVWPNYFVGNTYLEEVAWMKNWLTNRLYWLDGSLPGICGGAVLPEFDGLEASIQSNLVESRLTLKITSDVNVTLQFQLFSLNGTMVKSEQIFVGKGEQTFDIDMSRAQSGMYIYRIFRGSENILSGKLVKMRQR